jgi:putative membrane protein
VTSLEWFLRSLHVLANLYWVGSIVAVAALLSAPSASPKERGELAGFVYRRIAAPAFGLSFLSGTVRLLLDLEYYFVTTHFMHAKLPLALGVIALHHVIGARVRRAAAGDAQAVRGTARLGVALAVLAAGAAWFALTKPI